MVSLSAESPFIPTTKIVVQTEHLAKFTATDYDPAVEAAVSTRVFFKTFCP